MSLGRPGPALATPATALLQSLSQLSPDPCHSPAPIPVTVLSQPCPSPYPCPDPCHTPAQPGPAHPIPAPPGCWVGAGRANLWLWGRICTRDRSPGWEKCLEMCPEPPQLGTLGAGMGSHGAGIGSGWDQNGIRDGAGLGSGWDPMWGRIGIRDGAGMGSGIGSHMEQG